MPPRNNGRSATKQIYDYLFRLRKGEDQKRSNLCCCTVSESSSQPASQSVSQSLREFLLDWDGILMFGTGHSLNENRTRKFEALV